MNNNKKLSTTTILLLSILFQVLCFSHFIHAQQTLSMDLSFNSQDASGTTVSTDSKYDPMPASATLSSIAFDLTYISSADAICTLNFAGESKTDVTLPSSEGVESTFSDSFTGEFASFESGSELSATMTCNEVSVILETMSTTFTYNIPCDETQGLIIDGFCVCYSTFDGVDCTQTHPGTCNVTEPSDLETVNPPYLDSIGSFSNGNLNLIAKNAFVQQRHTQSISIGSSTSHYCSFPGPFWAEKDTTDQEQCEDQLVSQIPWPVATSECDLTRSETVNNIVYDGFLNVVQIDETGEIRGTPTTRSTKSVMRFQVAFPKTVTLELTNPIDYFAPIDVPAVLEEQSYDVDTAKGSVTLFSSVQWPFSLVSPSISVDNEDLIVSIQSQVGGNLCPETQDSACEQRWDVEISAVGELCRLDGTYNATFALECRGAGNCPLSGHTAALVFTITSSDFCATVAEDLDVTGSLDPVEKLAYFTGETVTLHAEVSSSQATITSIVPVQVKTTLDSTETIIYDGDGNPDPANVDFTIVSATADETDFSFTLAESVFPIAADQNTNLDVEAILAITYEGNTKKRFTEFRHIRSVMEPQQLDTSVGTKFVYGLRENNDGSSDEGSSNGASSASPMAVVMIIATVLGLLF